jgi:GntR family transcriptional regulator
MLLTINEKDIRPIYIQLIGQIKEQVSNGTLRPGDELPSVRELADSLGINMHTARNAYLKLRDQGIINLRLGRKAKIARLTQSSPSAITATNIGDRLREIIVDALLAGLSPSDFRELVNQQLEQAIMRGDPK